MAAVSIETDGLAKKMEQVDLKDKEPCILVLGMAGSGKSSFVQVTAIFQYFIYFFRESTQRIASACQRGGGG